MNFYNNSLFLILLGFSIPIFLLAQSQDYLSVTGSLFNGQINLESVEQHVFKSTDAVIHKSGSYEARIVKEKKVISNNFFEITENPELGVEIEDNKPEETFKSNKATFNVKLPLTENLDAANSTIEVWKGGGLLYSKKLIELPVEILGVSSNTIIDQRSYLGLSYLFHLYYDNDQLFADRDFEFKYDVIPEEFVPETYNTQFPFKGEIINFKNEVAAEFLFDPGSYGNNPGEKRLLVKGKISVKAPYVPDGQKAVFYDSQGRTLLTVFVSESSFCNDDGVCNSERGEDNKTCSNDCKALPTVDSQQPTTEGKGLSGTVWALTILALAFVGVGGWYAWRRWRKVKYIEESQFTNKLP